MQLTPQTNERNNYHIIHITDRTGINIIVPITIKLKIKAVSFQTENGRIWHQLL